MKIDDTPFRFRAGEGTEARNASRVQGQHALSDLDMGDLAFLDMLNSLSGSVQSALTTPQTRPAEKKEPAEKKKAEPKSESKPADTPAAPVTEKPLRLVEDDSVKLGREASEMLRTVLSPQDAAFFQQTVLNGFPPVPVAIPIQSVIPVDGEGNLQSGGLPVSRGLGRLLETAYKSGRPLRVELDDQTAVVLKFFKGRVSAEFISADRGLSHYLQQHLDDLRERMLARDLPVGTLAYKQQEDSRRQRQQQPDSDPTSDFGEEK